MFQEPLVTLSNPLCVCSKPSVGLQVDQFNTLKSSLTWIRFSLWPWLIHIFFWGHEHSSVQQTPKRWLICHRLCTYSYSSHAGWSTSPVSWTRLSENRWQSVLSTSRGWNTMATPQRLIPRWETWRLWWSCMWKPDTGKRFDASQTQCPCINTALRLSNNYDVNHVQLFVINCRGTLNLICQTQGPWVKYDLQLHFMWPVRSSKIK